MPPRSLTSPAMRRQPRVVQAAAASAQSPRCGRTYPPAPRPATAARRAGLSPAGKAASSGAGAPPVETRELLLPSGIPNTIASFAREVPAGLSLEQHAAAKTVSIRHSLLARRTCLTRATATLLLGIPRLPSCWPTAVNTLHSARQPCTHRQAGAAPAYASSFVAWCRIVLESLGRRATPQTCLG